MSRGLWLGLLFAGVAFNPLSADATNKSAPPRVTGVVNLNNGTPEQLKMLPGVKDKAVAEIIAHRAKHPFTRPEELVKVKGFSKKRYERVKPFITVRGDSSIKMAEKLVRKAVRAASKKSKKP
ncbi:MAG TPA: helix-hairpin-helix domain-containing protein [Myxococcaceae bacterium]|nr:helix-hairpin-helix domain-containing protein [Myxococcaceae bacterium]